MSINSDYSTDCPECNSRVRVAANYCERCGYHLAGDRDDDPEHEFHRSPQLERGKAELKKGLKEATGFMHAQINENGSITVRYSLEEDMYNNPGIVFDALIHAIEHPEDPLDLDDVERILRGQEEEVA